MDFVKPQETASQGPNENNNGYRASIKRPESSETSQVSLCIQD